MKKIDIDSKYYNAIDTLLDMDERIHRTLKQWNGMTTDNCSTSIKDLRIDENLNVYKVEVYNEYGFNKIEEVLSLKPIYTKMDICIEIMEDYAVNKDWYESRYKIRELELAKECEIFLSELSNRN